MTNDTLTHALRPPRTFEDLELGEHRSSEPYTVTTEEIIEFARKYDPQWFHTDSEAAKASTFGGLIASGVQTLGIWRRLDHEVNGDIDNIAGMGLDEVRFVRPVRPGDRLRLESEIIDLKRSTSKARGTVTLNFRLLNQLDEIVLTLVGTNLVNCRS